MNLCTGGLKAHSPAGNWNLQIQHISILNVLLVVLFDGHRYIVNVIYCVVAGPDGQQHWYKHFPYCGGAFQSPLDIESELLFFDPSLRPVEVQNYNLSPNEQLTLGNNGHSCEYEAREWITEYVTVHRSSKAMRTWGSFYHKWRGNKTLSKCSILFGLKCWSC